MNICTIFLHIRNKKPQNQSIADIIKGAFRTGQMAGVENAASSEFSKQGEVFRNVCVEDDLLVAKKIKNARYFVFGEDACNELDCLDIDVYFIAKTSDLTRTISEIMDNMKTKLKLYNKNIDLSYREKKVKIYKVENNDINKDAIYVTANFENKNVQTRYEIIEFRVMLVLLVLSAFASMYVFFEQKEKLDVSLSIMATIMLTFISGLIKRKVVSDTVKITDFTNIFSNDNVQDNVPDGSGKQMEAKTYETPDCGDGEA